MGTLDYMPVEQRRDAATADARSNLWSLAATLYQMLTGEPPRVIELDAVPQHLRSVLSTALKSQRENRYQSAADFKEALRNASPNTTAVADGPALDVGTCSSCGAQNEPTRKSCRSCTASMRVDCLNCSNDIPVWEDVCGECGGRQSELLAELRESVTSNLMAKANAAFESFDDDKALSTLQQLDDAVGHVPAAVVLQEKAATRQKEATNLKLEIQEAISRLRFRGLLAKVQRFAELRPTFRALNILTHCLLYRKRWITVILAAIALVAFSAVRWSRLCV